MADPLQPLPVLGACAGYCGLELGVGRCVPVRAIALVEREAYAAANLVAAMESGVMDPCPVHTDVRAFPWGLYRGRVAGFLAGYPCQPESAAGKRQGKADERWLWPYLRHGVAVVRPAWCFFENVSGHVARGLGDVLQDLGSMGYRTTAGIFSAVEVGAPHLRKRVFIFAADPNGPWKRQLRWMFPDKRRRIAHRASEAAADADRMCPKRRRGSYDVHGAPRPSEDQGKKREWYGDPAINSGAAAADSESARPQVRRWRILRPGEPRPCDGLTRNAWWTAEPGLCGSDDAPPLRIDRLRLLGNGVVPATAELAFRNLVRELKEETA